MIKLKELFIVNYCHPNCIPLMNIMRLPKDEAFLLARKLSDDNKDKTAFGRFADFENYYPRRVMQDDYLYNAFIASGGQPKEKHPLSFLLQGSDYLNNWFDNGIVTKIPLKIIPSMYISFTYGDSCAVLGRKGEISVLTKEMMLDIIKAYKGSIDDFMRDIALNHYYIEVQLWNDDYITFCI